MCYLRAAATTAASSFGTCMSIGPSSSTNAAMYDMINAEENMVGILGPWQQVSAGQPGLNFGSMCHTVLLLH